MPPDHIKQNIVKMLHCNSFDGAAKQESAIDTGNFGKGATTKHAYIAYKAPDMLNIQKQKMKDERQRIRNVIGNNPFRVRNYVQGDEVSNDLMPLKLLNPKPPVFANDDDFIEHFLAEKRKEELKKLQKLGRGGKKKIRVGGGLSSAYAESVLSQISTSRQSKQSVKKQTFKTQIDTLTERSRTGQPQVYAKSSSPELEDQPHARMHAESELRRLSSGMDEEEATPTQVRRESVEGDEDVLDLPPTVITFQDDPIFGKFNRGEALRKAKRRSEVRRASESGEIAPMMQVRQPAPPATIQVNAQSLAQMNFVPLGMQNRDGLEDSKLMKHNSRPLDSDVSANSMNQGLDYANKKEEFIVNQFGFDESGASFLPVKIKTFLTKKQGRSEQDITGLSSGMLPNASGSYLSPSLATLPKDPLQKKIQRNLVPGNPEPAPLSKAIQKLSQILSGARKLENHSLSLRNLATQLDSKIHQDRSTTNLSRAPSLLSNLAFFEKEFKLKKYEIEEFYLQRKAQADTGNNQDLKQLGSIGNLNQSSAMQLSNVQSGASYPKILQPVNSSNRVANIEEVGEPGSKDVIHVTLEGSSLQQLIRLIQEYT